MCPPSRPGVAANAPGGCGPLSVPGHGAGRRGWSGSRTSAVRGVGLWRDLGAAAPRGDVPESAVRCREDAAPDMGPCPVAGLLLPPGFRLAAVDGGLPAPAAEVPAGRLAGLGRAPPP